MTTSQIPFSERDTEEILTFAEAAEILRTSENTLRWWRQRKTGPRFFKIGRRLVTTVGDLRTFMRDQRRAATPLIR
ncbi:helix-turn-helix domain-containing protein [Nocardioides sp. CCNWLW239]|uniref:helix-turn-helix domain-containing protein n=1 Tax=Nocardioides sp. CCNWLW239 TaxID=3128902 RepID=UPI0030168EC9